MLAVEDLNGDGDPDVLTGNRFWDNDGTGSLSQIFHPDVHQLRRGSGLRRLRRRRRPRPDHLDRLPGRRALPPQRPGIVLPGTRRSAQRHAGVPPGRRRHRQRWRARSDRRGRSDGVPERRHRAVHRGDRPGATPRRRPHQQAGARRPHRQRLSGHGQRGLHRPVPARQTPAASSLPKIPFSPESNLGVPGVRRRVGDRHALARRRQQQRYAPRPVRLGERLLRRPHHHAAAGRTEPELPHHHGPPHRRRRRRSRRHRRHGGLPPEPPPGLAAASGRIRRGTGHPGSAT